MSFLGGLFSTKPKIGLALGSGGSRGLAHVGVIRVLEKAGIPIDIVTGSSIGAWVGALYATAKNSDRLLEVALSKDWRSIASVLLDFTPRGGLIKGEKMATFLKKTLEHKNFADCRIPFAAVATEFKTGKVHYMTDGDLVTALRASMAVPFMFKPVVYKRRVYLDGGLAEPVPVAAAKALGADIVIAVNLDGDHLLVGNSSTQNPFSVLTQSLQVVRYHLAHSNVKDAQIVVEPQMQSASFMAIGWKGFLNPEGIIKAGERAMQKQLPQLLELLKIN